MGRKTSRVNRANYPRRYRRAQEAYDNGCRKRPYDTKTECLQAISLTLKVAHKMDKQPPSTLRPYKCRKCGKWHMTSQEPRYWEKEQETAS